MLHNDQQSIGLYVHIPFCIRKCLFCSFVVSIGQTHRMVEYVDALIKESYQYKGTKISSIYLGGGTPGFLPDGEIKRLMDFIRTNFICTSDCEVTIEANPENITEDKAACFKECGFTRISLGAQTLNERYLKFLGRNHDAAAVCRAVTVLKKHGFNNINIDLMYGFPKQTREEVETDVALLAALGSQHMSLYTLTIEPNSRFFMTQVKLDSDDHLAEQFEAVCTLLPYFGYEQYEISNFAKPGFHSRHNSHYWQGGRYIGLGVGAHGFLNNRRYWHTDKLNEYLNDPLAIENFEDLEEYTLLMERICFGLRTSAGVLSDLIPQEKKPLIDQWLSDGLLEIKGDRLVTTLEGKLVLDELSTRLI